VAQETAPVYTPADYLQASQMLTPRGAAWPVGLGSIIATVLGALANTWYRVNLAAANLLVDAFPGQCVQLLPEWEQTLGLPDPCAGEAPTLQERQAQVLARFVGGGGQSKPFFINLAKTLGFTVTITEFTGANAFLWRVNASMTNAVYFRVGVSTIGEPLSSINGTAVLECVFNALKPAHTTVEFSYS
jgi:uncharacterized protein YmfQ (DUF2313 family)